MSHADALLTPQRQLKLAASIVDDGWLIRRTAERFQVSPTTARKWSDRYRTGDPAAMADRAADPGRTTNRTERRIINLRLLRRWGLHRIILHLHMARSTVSAVLRRYKLPVLRHLDQNTGLAMRRPQPLR
ncbi:hypothetical protein RQCS_59180 (plasmid) [Rhodococcus qingshengii]|nr:hypothetical protein RQCS_59180 [Rhodococcus qingshengii]